MLAENSKSPSEESFADATDVPEGFDSPEKDIQKEAPLSTPNKNNHDNAIKSQTETAEETPNNVITIFDVATEIENMLKEINNEIDKNDELVISKINNITQRLDKIEENIRKST